MNNTIKIPVVMQTRKILTGVEKGAIKKYSVWCKHIEDVDEARKLPQKIVGTPCYEVIEARIVVREGPEFDKTYEQEEGA